MLKKKKTQNFKEVSVHLMKLETEKQIKSKKVRRKEIEFASTFMLSEPE